MSQESRRLFAALSRAHRLSARERRLCRRLAALAGLRGNEGPATSPAALFFRPSLWKLPDPPAGRRPFRLDREEVAALAARLFSSSNDELPEEW